MFSIWPPRQRNVNKSLRSCAQAVAGPQLAAEDTEYLQGRRGGLTQHRDRLEGAINAGRGGV